VCVYTKLVVVVVVVVVAVVVAVAVAAAAAVNFATFKNLKSQKYNVPTL
jgi:hypothetical protein